jgi:hypothetical protein
MPAEQRPFRTGARPRLTTPRPPTRSLVGITVGTSDKISWRAVICLGLVLILVVDAKHDAAALCMGRDTRAHPAARARCGNTIAGRKQRLANRRQR